MTEVDCICGERIVFLDPEVEVKTCPNCGMPVYQHGLPAQDERIYTVKSKSKLPKQAWWLAALLVAVLLAVGVVVGTSVVRTSALQKAQVEVERAQTAAQQGDYHAARGAYERALAAYRRWGAAGSATDEVEAALEEVSVLVQRSGVEHSAQGSYSAMPISLEALARQAYIGPAATRLGRRLSPQSASASPAAGAEEALAADAGGPWRQEFQRNYAGRWVVIRSKVEKREGSAFKASALTVSYRVFSPSGREVEISFDGPFFERYRVKEGTECVLRAVLSRMDYERGQTGARRHWVLVLDSTKSIFVTDVEMLKELGWEVDDELARLVSRQQSLSAAY
ncbi:MAG: hypothetical protein J7M19_04785 [Planctomycetes bacterium]|nr:hypothetical protein [Planctomycetota bacterium]